MKYLSRKGIKFEKKQIAGILLFLMIFAAFVFGISGISRQTAQNQTETLHLAISRSIAHAYASQGYYPESLEALLEQYPITYDTDKYFVDYQVLGKNIFPDVTIIEK